MRIWLTAIITQICLFSWAQQIECTADEFCDSISHGLEFEFKQQTRKFSNVLNCAALQFPELSGYKIEVKRKKIITMMAARPKRNFIFHKKDNRTYVILITDKYSMNAEMLYNSMSSCAIKGVLGHELSHISNYTQKSNFEMLCFGIKYVFNKKEIEKETDLLAIERGFGSGLVEYNTFICNSPWVNKRYLKRKSKYYLSVAELDNTIKGTM